MPGPQPPQTVSVLSQTIALTDSEIKALPTTPIVGVPAQSGKVLRFVSAALITDVTAGTYGNVAGRDLFIGWGIGPSSFPASGSIDAEAPLGGVTAPITLDTIEPVTSADQDLNDVVNKPLSLFVFGGAGNFTGGNTDNSVQLTILYVVIDIA